MLTRSRHVMDTPLNRPPPHSGQSSLVPPTMLSISLLGFANGKPTKFRVDPAQPHSSVSEAFLFRNDLNPVLDVSGRYHKKTTLLVPSLGGYYASSDFMLLGSVGNGADVVLGADWLSQCRPSMTGNALGRPAPELAGALPDGHSWELDGMCLVGGTTWTSADRCYRFIPAIFPSPCPCRSIPVLHRPLPRVGGWKFKFRERDLFVRRPP